MLIAFNRTEDNTANAAEEKKQAADNINLHGVWQILYKVFREGS